MPKKDKYDLIVVGAGPGGTACAVTAARRGLDVLLVERAEVPGQKNMSGAVLFTPISEEIFPGFSEAPFMENHTTINSVSVKWTIDNDEHEFGVTLTPGTDIMTDMPNITRPESDKWFAEQTVMVGAEPLYSTRVDDVIIDRKAKGGPRVIGIVTETGEKIYANAVADCSGVDSIIAKKSGLLPHHSWKKEMIAVKLIYKLDREEIWKRFEMWWGKDDNPATDWSTCPVYFGEDPTFYAAHIQADWPQGVIEVTVYQTMQEMVESRQNIWQRIDWYLQAIARFLEGAELVRVNMHPLNCFDLVGHELISSYMPGLVLIGDAGSFANPVESWGANVAQWQGRVYGELVADMKEDNDWSAERFAEYEERWKNSWVGDDLHLVPLNNMFRNGKFGAALKAVDAMIVRACDGKIDCESYSELLPAAMGKALPYLTDLVPMPPIRDAVKRAADKAVPFLEMAAKLRD